MEVRTLLLRLTREDRCQAGGAASASSSSSSSQDYDVVEIPVQVLLVPGKPPLVLVTEVADIIISGTEAVGVPDGTEVRLRVLMKYPA